MNNCFQKNVDDKGKNRKLYRSLKMKLNWTILPNWMLSWCLADADFQYIRLFIYFVISNFNLKTHLPNIPDA